MTNDNNLNNESNNESNSEKDSITTQIIFKDEFYLLLEEERNKCIRSILWTAEIILDKNSEEFKHLRKSVLDSVNDFHRRIETISNKIL